ncbi:MAG: FmdB family zinc ribbon protein [Candidatus Dormibacteria bacterium]
MPTYAYRCDAGHQFETWQGITDPALTTCLSCGLPVRRVLFPVGVVFKGQGFYKTDSRSTAGASSNGTASKSGKEAAPSDGATDGGAKPPGKSDSGGAPTASTKAESASNGAASAGGTT